MYWSRCSVFDSDHNFLVGQRGRKRLLVTSKVTKCHGTNKNRDLHWRLLLLGTCRMGCRIERIVGWKSILNIDFVIDIVVTAKKWNAMRVVCTRIVYRVSVRFAVTLVCQRIGLICTSLLLIDLPYWTGLILAAQYYLHQSLPMLLFICF